MTELGKDLQRGGPLKTFSRSGIQTMSDGIEGTLSVARQIDAFRQILAEQAVGIFIAPPLPGTMGISEEDLEVKPLGKPLVLGHFFPPIIGQRFPQRGRYVAEFLRKLLASTLRICPFKPSQDDETRGPFHESADRRAIASFLDEIPFPVAGDRAGRHFCRPFSNERHVGDLASPITPTCPRTTGFMGLPQRGQQFLAQRSPWEHIQAGIDGFRRDPFAHVGRILSSKAPRNLFRRMAMVQLALHIAPQPGIEEFSWPPSLATSGRGQGLGRTGTIRLPLRGIAAALTTQGAWRPPQDGGHRP